MRYLAIFRNALRWLFHRRQAEAELTAEFQDHLEQEIASNLRSGMAPDEARAAALRLIGPISYHQEQCRDSRGAAFLETFARDLRYAFHMLRRTPLFTAAAVITLGLGIGANTTVFTFIENIVLRQLPVQDARQLAFLNWGGNTNLSYPDYIDFRDRNRVFSDLIAYRYNPVSMSFQERDNYRAWGYEATGNYFEALGIKPLLGRFFSPVEDRTPDANPVLVISHRFWLNHFAGDPLAIGRQVRVNSYPFTVIGVAPPGFGGTELITNADFWVPMNMVGRIEPGSDWIRSRYAHNIWAMGRLRPGISRAIGEADLDRIARDLAAAYPDLIDTKDRFHLSEPGLIGNALRGPTTAFGVVLMCVGGLVLLLACVNLAGMLTARAADRQREIGIRLALGAGRGRLLRQLMTESLLLAAIGGAIGLAIAFGACGVFSSWHVNVDIPIATTLEPNAAVLAFTAAAALLTTLIFGLAPALQATRTDLIRSLKGGAAQRRRWGVRDLIVTGQIALSVILVICSVLVVRSLQHALSLNLGFVPDHAVSASFDLRLQGYDQAGSRSFDAAVVAKASALPGMQAVGIIDNFPLRIGENNSVVSRTDRPVPPPSERHGAIIYKISPGYLQAAGTRLMLGRDIDDHDRRGAPSVAVVNQALTDLLFPKENPIGKHFRMTLNQADAGLEIVGVAETGKYESLGEHPKPVAFLPLAQSGTEETTLVARTALPPDRAVEMLRRTILDLDPALTLYSVGTLKDQLSFPLFPARAAAIVLGVFGVLAMVLAATGLFALMAYAVSRRTREIGIRIALGARTGTILSSVLNRTLKLCAAGILLGVLATLAGSRVLSAILYGVSPNDPLTYATAILLIALVAGLACWRPAAHAIRIDPGRTLRED